MSGLWVENDECSYDNVDDDFSRHWSIWRLTPEFDTSLISVPHTGHFDEPKWLAFLNILVREVCVPASASNFLFLLTSDPLFSNGNRAFSLDWVPIGVVCTAAKLSNSFVCTGLGLAVTLSDRSWDFPLPRCLAPAVSEVLSVLVGFGWTWKKFLSETGGVSALAWHFLLMGVCGSRIMSLAEVGMATVESLLCSSCNKKEEHKL